MHKIRLKFVISHLPVAGALYSAGQSMILGETWVQGKGIRFIVRYLCGIFTSYWLCNVKCVLSSLTHGFSIKKWGEKNLLFKGVGKTTDKYMELLACGKYQMSVSSSSRSRKESWLLSFQTPPLSVLDSPNCPTVLTLPLCSSPTTSGSSRIVR